jgi:hypothetical protein
MSYSINSMTAFSTTGTSLENTRKANSLFQNQVQAILSSFSQNSFVLSTDLLNRINESKALTGNILQNYQNRLDAAESEQSNSDNTE